MPFVNISKDGDKIDITFEHVSFSILLHDDVAQGIHIVNPDEKLRIAYNGYEIVEGKYFKEIVEIVERIKKRSD